LVTAEHVIAGLLRAGQDIYLRVNAIGGTSVEIGIPDAAKAFHFHPNNAYEATDVAVCPFTPSVVDENTGETVNLDVMQIPVNGPENSFMPNEEFAKRVIGLGAEVAIIGLFRSHYGGHKNIPVVRVGNIAALPGEPVLTKYAGPMNAYLIEARSIAGLSGSPVFAFPDPSVVLATGLAKRRIDPQGSCLLGLVHGHFDVRNMNEDVVADEDALGRGVHTGVGVVIPAQKIIETIEHPTLVSMRETLLRQHRSV
jgi:hypothetical protein